MTSRGTQFFAKPDELEEWLTELALDSRFDFIIEHKEPEPHVRARGTGRRHDCEVVALLHQ